MSTGRKKLQYITPKRLVCDNHLIYFFVRILGNFVILHFQSLESNNHLYEYRIMRTMPSVTQKELHEELGISITAIQKLINQLVAKNYIEKNLTDGSWRVIISPSL